MTSLVVGSLRLAPSVRIMHELQLYLLMRARALLCVSESVNNLVRTSCAVRA